jgi:cellulose synthase/poly-beta-1,6-N-acetylglucosamine synthase-like glycosyltransferase
MDHPDAGQALMLFFPFVLILGGSFAAIFLNPWGLVVLCITFVTAVLPNAKLWLPISCVAGAVSTAVLAALYSPATGSGLTLVILFSVGYWFLLGVTLWLFVSHGLWRKNKIPEASSGDRH